MVKPVLSFPAGQLAETLQSASSPDSSVAALFSSQVKFLQNPKGPAKTYAFLGEAVS